MHTHYTQLYITGNFPYLTDVVRISGREWAPTRPSHHLNLFSIYVVFAISVRVNNPWPNVMFLQFLNVLHYHVLLWKSIQSSAIDYFKSHLLAQHSTNEGGICYWHRMIFNLNNTTHKSFTTKYTQYALAFHMNMLKWWYIIVTCSVNYFYGLSRRRIQLMQ